VIRGSALTRPRTIDGYRNGVVSPSAVLMGNRLLASHGSAFAHWVPQLEPVLLTFGEVLWRPDSLLPFVYFPTTAIISLLYKAKNVSAEVAVVGREGLVGVGAVMGSDHTWCRAVVQSAGEGFRLDSNMVKAEFARTGGAAFDVLLRYSQALMTQIQTAVCNRLHCVKQQFCRRLLASLDRSSGDDLSMTHDLIATTLGVRREGVTQAAIKLQKAGIIRYSRGRITVLDRAGLEAASCECYSVVKREYDRLLAERSP
jgi:hypothetical protein